MQADSRRINITVPESLLQKIDAAAEKLFVSRSEFIRMATIHKITHNPDSRLEANLGVIYAMTNKQLTELVRLIANEKRRRFAENTMSRQAMDEGVY